MESKLLANKNFCLNYSKKVLNRIELTEKKSFYKSFRLDPKNNENYLRSFSTKVCSTSIPVAQI